MHWNGSAWSVVPSPLGVFTSVSALSSNDVWAVGIGPNGTFTAHWNGNAWSEVPSPSPPDYPELHSVAVISANDVWAVGFIVTGNTTYTLTMHWDGTQWSIVPSPSPGVTDSRLFGVAAVSANDVWAVGHTFDITRQESRTLVLHWNGSAWSVVPSLDVTGLDVSFQSVAAVSANDLWAVGYAPGGALIARYNDPCVTPTPSATATRTPTATSTATRTNTPVPPSATPTLTTCQMSFSDVDQYNPFYVYIRCLYCRGIVSGYADNTFRPYANVTRGQLSKMVSNAAGSSEAVSGQTFRDVPPTNIFYVYIMRLANRGVIGGYSDAANCPASVGGAPCFRWERPVTRGQAAKIVSNAAGFTDTPPAGTLTFTDVPQGSTFYLFIERLARRGIVSGYECGNPTINLCTGLPEVCDSARRPYFRPCEDFTRGQASKIVANTFYPVNCAPGTPQIIEGR